MLSILARSCPPGTTPTECLGTPGYSQACSPVAAPPKTFSPDAYFACYKWAAVFAQPSWWTPWRIAVLALTVTIIATAWTAYFRAWSRVPRILLALVAAWGLVTAVIGLPSVHLLHISLAAIVICGAMAVACIATLYMTREARS